MLDLLEAIRAVAEMLMKKHGLTGWKFKYHTKKRACGTCYYRSKTIAVSRYHAEQSELKDIVDTVLHEIAHALAPGDGHGPRWVDTCQRIGATPKQYYVGPKIDVPAKWILECPTCQRQVKRFRKPTRKISCGTCSPGKFSVQHVFIIRRATDAD